MLVLTSEFFITNSILSRDVHIDSQRRSKKQNMGEKLTLGVFQVFFSYWEGGISKFQLQRERTINPTLSSDFWGKINALVFKIDLILQIFPIAVWWLNLLFTNSAQNGAATTSEEKKKKKSEAWF